MSESRRILRPETPGPRAVRASAAVERVATPRTLLDLAEELADAMMAREGTTIHELLGDPRCAQLPREVREEAMVFSTLPVESNRAPMRTLLHLHRMRELEHAEGAARAAEQIELFEPGGERGRRGHMRLSRGE